MADVVATLGLRVDSNGAIRAVRQFGDAADRTARQASLLERSVVALAGGFGAYQAIQWARQTLALADAYTNLRSKLGLVSGGLDDLNRAQGALFAVSQATRTGLEGNVALYASLARSTRDLGLTQSQLVDITRTVAQSFLVTGASAAETNSAVRQLSQAFASGVLRGDEFNSLSESAPRLQQALAQSLGVTIGQLRAMSEQGKLTSQVLAQGILMGGAGVGADAAQVALTVGGAYTQLRNAMLLFVGSVDQANGSSRAIAEALSLLAGNIGTIVQLLTAAAAVMATRWVTGLLEGHRATLTLADSVLRGNSVMLSSVEAQRGAAAAALQRAHAQEAASAMTVTALRAEQAQMLTNRALARESLATSSVRLAQPRVAESGAPSYLPFVGKAQAQDQREVIAALAARTAAQQTLSQVQVRGVAAEVELRAALAAQATANNAALAAGVRRIAVLEATTLASRAAAAATGALSTAMAFLGGPIGVAILAATLLYSQLDKLVEVYSRLRYGVTEQTDAERAATDAALETAHARKAAADATNAAGDAAAKRAAKHREELRDRDIEIAKQNALNAAFGKSALTLALITNEYDARAERAKNAIDHTAAETAALNKRTEAMRREKDEAARLEAGREVREATASNAERERSARQEYDLVGLTTKAAGLLRNEHEAINAEIAARRTLQGDALDAQLRAIANERMWKDATVERLEVLRKGMDAGEPFIRALKDMQRHVSSFFADIFTKGITSFRDLFTRIKDMFLQLVADMVAASVVKKLAGVVAGLLGNIVPKTALGADGKTIAGAGGQGMAMAGAGLAGLGVGYGVGQSLYSTSHGTAGNYARGAIGGAASGAAAGFMIAGPAGAAVGAVAGLVGGILGIGSASKAAAKAMAEAQENVRLSTEALRASVRGDTLGAAIAQVNADREQRRRAIEDAYQGGGSGSDQVRRRNAALAEMNALENQRIAQLREEYALMQTRRAEDLQVRLLTAQGRDSEARALALQLAQQREREDLVKSFGASIDPAEAATLALLDQVQAQEALAAATNKANGAALNMVSGYRLQAQIFGAMSTRDPSGANPGWAGAGRIPSRSTSTTPAGGGDLTVQVMVPNGTVLGDLVLKDFRRRKDRGDAGFTSVLS